MERIIATVSQLNNFVKRTFDANPAFSDIWIKGEISNYKKHFSGHHYMTLKDDGGVLKAVMFKQNAFSLKTPLADGMKVMAHGRVNVWEQGGVYQLYIDEIEPDGVGELYIAYERLKKKLEEEGLFLPEHKQQLPNFPKTVGVVTASTGAAIRDIINVITRRYPCCEIVLYPAKVQGEGAGKSVSEGIEYFNKTKSCDVMIVGRGGGSIEDLWAFNEEIVAYSIYNSKIPIISAVGHEVDFTIADFVADLRAPTPSAAAELCVPSKEEIAEKIFDLEYSIRTNMLRNIEKKKLLLNSIKILSPQEVINNNYMRLDMMVKQITNSTEKILTSCKERYAKSITKLDAISPLKVMARGYSLATDDENKIIKSVKQLDKKEKFVLKLTDGERKCRVIKEEKDG